MHFKKRDILIQMEIQRLGSLNFDPIFVVWIMIIPSAVTNIPLVFYGVIYNYSKFRKWWIACNQHQFVASMFI